MAYTLGNKCAKNCRKRTIIVQVIIEDVVTCFFGTQCIIRPAVLCKEYYYTTITTGTSTTTTTTITIIIYLPPTKEEVNAFARVRLSVCLSVSKITQKRVHVFG